MANVTDPLIKSVQGSDPQNLMEYITRQKIYDSRFWKEECFGLTAADVTERAAQCLKCVGGTYSGMGKPSKFLSLTLKLLQLQPDLSVVQTFLEQDHFKYLKCLGAFYLRLTGRPQDIYELLDPLYKDFSKLKYRDVNEWRLMHVDEFVDELLTQPICCGIAMPRLPRRETLQEAGYLEEGPRETGLHEKFLQAGGIKEYLKQKVDEEQDRISKSVGTPEIDYSADPTSAIALWKKRYGKVKKQKKEQSEENDGGETSEMPTTSIEPKSSPASIESRKRKNDDEVEEEEKRRKKKKKEKKKYGTLFKASAVKDEKETKPKTITQESNNKPPPEENSEEYWNNLRSSLGMSKLKK